jgi:hypothetical protein
MNENDAGEKAHPRGETSDALVLREEEEMMIDTPGGRFRASFDDRTPVSSLASLVFFAQFLQASGRFDAFCQDAPLSYASPNAPAVRDVLGTLILGILAGHWRYAHLSALRFDAVAPGLLGLSRVVSEDSVRRGLRRLDQLGGRHWLTGHLRQSWGEFLTESWILDVDTTIKPIYGRQEGAKVGYNPAKPGRPSHALHTYWISTLRLCLDVEVHPGNAHAAGYGLDGLWALIDQLPKPCRPLVVRGDCGYGHEACLLAAESRGQPYLFKLRRTKKARDLIKLIEGTTETRWQEAGQGWTGVEATLQLTGWSRERRVVVLRRRLREARSPRARRQWARQELNLLVAAGVDVSSCEVVDHEYQILVTSLPYAVATLAPMYRERGDAENPFDELKNQWGWGGFTAKTLAACQHTARIIALVYNWWSIYNRLVEPGQHHEAITSRPRLLGGVAKQTDHAGQRRLTVRLLHADAPDLKPRIVAAVRWLQNLLSTAEQLTVAMRWHRIIRRILDENFGIRGPAPPALPAPA